MVGVPRSQGCRHCRRKKKGCDLQRPVCGQCARLGLDCSYESKKWTFVSHDPGQGSSSIPIRTRSIPNLRREASVSPPAGLQDRELIRTSTEIGLAAAFWNGFLPKAEIHSVRGVYVGFWCHVVRDLASFDSTVNICLSACASTALGRFHSDPTLLQEGTRLYAKALRETNQALQDPVRAQGDGTLACVKLLSMYENFRFDNSGGITTQGHDWHKHIEGTCRIVELRGPEKHVALHGHALFEEARVLAIISGLTRRRPNFFTDPAWYTIPWQTHPRNLRDELCDIMIALPDVLYRQDLLSTKLKSLKTNQALFEALTQGQSHINRCTLIATALREWEQKALTACLELSSQPPADFTGPLTLLEVVKDFGYGFFHVVNMYWVACMILYSSVWIVKRNVLLATGAASKSFEIPALMQLPDIPAWINPRTAASNIAKSASHYFEPEAGFWGPWTSTFPLGAALHYYAATDAHDSAEMRLMRELFKRSNFGQSAGEFLRSMANTAPSRTGDTRDPREHTAMANSWYGKDALQEDKPA